VNYPTGVPTGVKSIPIAASSAWIRLPPRARRRARATSPMGCSWKNLRRPE
jgi:hypothetical protein